MTLIMLRQTRVKKATKTPNQSETLCLQRVKVCAASMTRAQHRLECFRMLQACQTKTNLQSRCSSDTLKHTRHSKKNVCHISKLSMLIKMRFLDGVVFFFLSFCCCLQHSSMVRLDFSPGRKIKRQSWDIKLHLMPVVKKIKLMLPFLRWLLLPVPLLYKKEVNRNWGAC